MSERDSQRSRVYAAENEAWREVCDTLHEKFPRRVRTISECQQEVRALAGRKRIVTKYPRAQWLRSAVVKTGRSGGVAYSFTNTISLGVWGRTHHYVLLHEAAHLIAPHAVKHGWEFCAINLWLWRQVRGVEAAKTLEASFKLHRVKYRKPRPKRELTPEQRAVLVERLAAARAAKAPAEPKPYRIIGGERVCATCPDGEYYWPCPEHAPELVSA